MSKVRALCISMSLDGYMAGPDQDLDNPLGRGGPQVFQWFWTTRLAREMVGKDGGSEGLDNDFVRRGIEGIGAHIIGRNMFGPDRGEWDLEWKGWWGPNPPYHHDVFVLSHHEREPLAMEGGTTFHFVTDGIERALELARAAAGDLDVRIGGGASTIRQFYGAGLLDELHVVLSPVLLGSGERVFDTPTPHIEGYEVRLTPSEQVTHLQLLRKA